MHTAVLCLTSLYPPTPTLVPDMVSITYYTSFCVLSSSSWYKVLNIVGCCYSFSKFIFMKFLVTKQFCCNMFLSLVFTSDGSFPKFPFADSKCVPGKGQIINLQLFCFVHVLIIHLSKQIFVSIF